MRTFIVAAIAAAAFTAGVPALAQLKAPEKGKEAAKVEIPKDTFYAGLGPSQYLVKSRLIGQPVVDKSGAKLATVDDVILGTADNKIDGLVIDTGAKKLGVRITAVKIETKDGKTTITLPAVTQEMVKSGIPAYGAR